MPALNDKAMNGSASESKIFRILSLDGGGSKGFYSLGVLGEIETLVGCRLCEKFDLIYGTSTGAIIAALLGLGKSVDEIKSLYSDKVVSVMSHWRPSRRSAALDTLAEEVFGDLKFDAFKTDIGIVGTRWKEERPIIFKTSRKQLFSDKAAFRPGHGCTIANAVVASCSAYPLFQRKVVTASGDEKIDVRDGGFAANNPTLYAIVDATESLGHARKDVRVVSVGVGEYPPPRLPVWSARKWISKLPSVQFLQKTMAISAVSMDQLRQVLFREVETVRIHARYTNPELATDMLEADLDKLNLLLQRGRDSACEAKVELKRVLM